MLFSPVHYHLSSPLLSSPLLSSPLPSSPLLSSPLPSSPLLSSSILSPPLLSSPLLSSSLLFPPLLSSPSLPSSPLLSSPLLSSPFPSSSLLSSPLLSSPLLSSPLLSSSLLFPPLLSSPLLSPPLLSSPLPSSSLLSSPLLSSPLPSSLLLSSPLLSAPLLFPPLLSAPLPSSPLCSSPHHSPVSPTCCHPLGGGPRLVNVTGPRVYTAGEYPGSYKFGSWGRDPKPDAGKENWYWRVILTTSNIYAHYVRRYTTLSALIVGISTPGNVQISPSNPTTNTIQGPSAVLYGEALYYNCYKEAAVCRFNLTSKTVQSTMLPEGTRVNSKGNYCHLEACYPYTDLDLATDENGVWVVYTTTQDRGNLVLARVEVEDGRPVLGETWHTSVYKNSATNSFVAFGVLYATRYVSPEVEEIFYSLDTATGVERFDVGMHISKMSNHIYSLNYSPVDQMIHVYGEGFMTSYKAKFE
uniref:Si:ch211-194m7.5 n=1 Tax=Gadus morhua TaxID=8049 RepID=A0A8C5AIK7_GADMO